MDEQKWLLGLLGSFRLEQNGAVVERLRPTKQNLVLAYVGMSPQTESPRADVAELFWPDVPLATALRYLSFTLCILRDRLRNLGLTDAIYVSPKTLQLNPSISTDAQLFQRRLMAAATAGPTGAKASRLQKALAAYGGELLPTVDAPWVEPERDRLTKLYEGALSELSDILQPSVDLADLSRHLPPSAWIEADEDTPPALPGVVSAPALAEELDAVATPSAANYEELLSFVHDDAEGLSGPDRSACLDRLNTRGPAVRAVLEEQVNSRDSTLGLELAGALLHYWLHTGAVDQGRWYVEKLLAQPSTASLAVRASALHAAGTLAYKAGALDDATERLGQAVPFWEQLGDRSGLLRTLSNLATVSYAAADYESARHSYGQCLPVARELGDENALSKLLLNAALTEIRLHQPARARTFLEERLDLAERLGDARAIGTTLSHLACVELMDGNNDDARAHAQASSEALDERLEPAAASLALRILGRVAHLEGDYDAAFARFHDSLQLAKESGDLRELAETMRYLALTFEATGHERRAAALCKQAIGLFEAVGDRHGASKAREALERIQA